MNYRQTFDLTFEHSESTVDYTGTVNLTDKDVKRIKSLQTMVVNLGLYEATFFNSCLDIISDDLEVNDNSIREYTDYCVVHVQDNFIRVTGCLKHDHYTFSTGIFSLDELEEVNEND